MSNVVLDLFSGTGSATKAFAEDTSWEAFRVEKDPEVVEEYGAELQSDILKVEPTDLPEADVVWASPPCTDFSIACCYQKWTQNKLPKSKSVSASVRLVYRTLWLIQEIEPDYWFLENPRGMMRRIMPFEPEGTVTYCQYGFDYMKPTDLYGDHPPSMVYRRCKPMDTCHLHNPSSRDGKYSGVFRDRTRRTNRMDNRQDTVKLERRSAFHQKTSGQATDVRSRVPFELSKEIKESVENPGQSQRQMNLENLHQ